MANFTAGTSFTDGVTNDVTAAKLNALIADAVPTSNLSLNSTTGTIANFTASTANITLGTIPTLTAGTTTSTNDVVTNGTITNLSATTSTFLGTITGSTNVVNIGSGQIYKDASGNVGIGTASPSLTLNVKSPSGDYRTAIFETSSTLGPSVQIKGSRTYEFRSTGTGATEGSGLFFIYDKTAELSRIAINSSGNVGIGATSINAKLEVNSSSAGSEVSRFEGSYTSAGSVVLSNWRRNGGAVASAVRYNDANVTMEFGTTTNHAQSFITNSTERLRITSDGDLLVGTTSNIGSHRCLIVQPNVVPVLALQCTGSDFANLITFYAANGTAKGTISATGSSVSYNTSSDYRLKTNIEPISNGIDRIKQLPVYRFNWIVDESGNKVDGFVAHEAQAIVPECVTGEKDAVDADGKPIYQGIDQSKIVPLLTAALKEAIAKIEILESKVAALEAA